MKRVVIPTRLQGSCIDDLGGGKWRIWLHTNDWIYGTYLTLYSNGMVTRTTARIDEGDDVITVKSAN